MKPILICLIVAGIAISMPASSQSPILDTSNRVTPEQLYYQMLHNDSICMENFQAIKEYKKMRTTSKVIQLVGGVILGTAGILAATDYIDTGSATFKAMLGSGGVLFITGWAIDWTAISKLNRVSALVPRYSIEADKNTRSTVFGGSKE